MSDAQNTDYRLEHYHDAGHGGVVYLILAAVLVFIAWASVFTLDEVARGSGEVITPSRIQVIQSVDGGVLEVLNVRPEAH